MNNEEFLLICDESGAKSYADQHNNIGVLAGYLISKGTYSEQFEEDLQKQIKSINLGKNKKVHITDLPIESKQKLRQVSFSLLKERNIPIFYSAIYVLGYKRFYDQFKQMHTEAYANAKNNGLGLSSNFNMPLLQSRLFKEVYASAYCYLISCGISKPKLLVLTDQIDNSILKKYESSIRDFHGTFSPYSESSTRYDYETRKIESMEFEISLSQPNGIDFPDISIYETELAIENTVFTLVADILVGSIRYELNDYALNSNYGCLNCFKAIQGHELCQNIMGLPTKSREISVLDKIFDYHP